MITSHKVSHMKVISPQLPQGQLSNNCSMYLFQYLSCRWLILVNGN